jgi:glycerophosphoryl diester phosphodiesterase
VTPLAIAHRAGNDLEALRLALEAGVDVVEADVHGFRGRLEVHHLRTLGPLPFLLDDWALVRASAPRLELATLLAAGREGPRLMLDLKGRRASVGSAVARAVHEAAPDTEVLVCSRHWPAVDAAARLPYVQPVYSAGTRRELARLLRLLAGRRVYGVSVLCGLLNAAVVAELHRSVEVVMTWPVNDNATLRRVVDIGVSGVISDEPSVLRQLSDTA